VVILGLVRARQLGEGLGVGYETAAKARLRMRLRFAGKLSWLRPEQEALPATMGDTELARRVHCSEATAFD
jgi:hypothetical protein